MSSPALAGKKAALLFAALFLILLALYTRGNDFPFYYHTDEPSKVAQLLGQRRNFFHPQLLLAVTQAVFAGLPHTPQVCAETGRWVSAAFAAGAATVFSLLALRLRGPVAALTTAVACGAHPMLFELAHYMKEDCAWIFGLALTFLAAERLERRPTAQAAWALGAAAGLAASGKYIGVTALVAALLFARGNRLRALAGFAVAFAAVNWFAFLHPIDAWNGLREEMVRLRDIGADQARVIQWRYLHKMLKFTWPIPFLPGIGAAAWIALRRDRRRTEMLLALFAVGFLALLLFTPRIKERYLLPTVEIVCVFTGLGAALVPRPIGAALAVACAGIYARDLAACWRDFHSDPRVGNRGAPPARRPRRQ